MDRSLQARSNTLGVLFVWIVTDESVNFYRGATNDVRVEDMLAVGLLNKWVGWWFTNCFESESLRYVMSFKAKLVETLTETLWIAHLSHHPLR
jgi:hypothetical protein